MGEDYTVPPGPPAGDITDNDKLMAAISYPIPLVAIIILIAEDMKARPFQRFHAVQALAVNVVLWVAITLVGCILAAVTFFIGGLCGWASPLLWLVTLYWAYEAYQGKYFDIPYLTDFLRKQNWL
ncbi:MAG: hypothetical protein M8467_05600 [Anaerolineae bacterium]|nr:hypothetical protein [Anaerolineae bacterium]